MILKTIAYVVTRLSLSKAEYTQEYRNTGIQDIDPPEAFNLRLLLPTIDTTQQLNTYLFLMIVFTQRVHIRGIAGLLPASYYITRNPHNSYLPVAAQPPQAPFSHRFHPVPACALLDRAQ